MDKSSRERVRAVCRGPCRSLLLVQAGPSQGPLDDVMRCNPGARGGCGHGQSPGRRACQSLVYPPAVSYSSADSSLQSWGDQQPGMGALICSRTCGRMGGALDPGYFSVETDVWQCFFRRLETCTYMHSHAMRQSSCTYYMQPWANCVPNKGSCDGISLPPYTSTATKGDPRLGA